MFHSGNRFPWNPYSNNTRDIGSMCEIYRIITYTTKFPSKTSWKCFVHFFHWFYWLWNFLKLKWSVLPLLHPINGRDRPILIRFSITGKTTYYHYAIHWMSYFSLSANKLIIESIESIHLNVLDLCSLV